MRTCPLTAAVAAPLLPSCRSCPAFQTKADQDLAANRTQENLDRQRKHMEESVKKMVKAASGKGGDQKKLGQVTSVRKRVR